MMRQTARVGSNALVRFCIAVRAFLQGLVSKLAMISAPLSRSSKNGVDGT